jgi:hypothetical protein
VPITRAPPSRSDAGRPPATSCGTSEQAVIPAKAGIQFFCNLLKRLDDQLRC